ncbi:MAG: hypothetical protein ACRC2R_26110 [Xenococcaceae cyanobacterium]
MNNLKNRLLSILYLISPLLLFALSVQQIIISVEKETDIALNDYSMLPRGVTVVDKVVLGRRKRSFSDGLYIAYYREFQHGIDKAFRRGAIELVCTNRGNILLVMKGYKADYVGPGESDNASLFINVFADNKVTVKEVKIKQVSFLSRKYFDTLVSAPLSQQEITSILKVLKNGTITYIGFSTMDGGNAFAGNVQVSEVKKIIDNCHP